MDFLDIIAHKKLGGALDEKQIEQFMSAAVNDHTPDYQLAALLMAIRLNGMTYAETALLTMAMARSGYMLKADVGGIPVDKHSTGGVGDTTTLVAVPLVAACGGKVVKMSGRGLGHTGGTVDKMESIPGMRTQLSAEEMLAIVRRIGCCVVGQSEQLAPADKRLYALRDVTSTVDSIPLIASSIMAKKLAGGAQAVVLDVKTGSGAILPDQTQALELARTMVEIGQHAGRNVSALITGMDEPLGSHVGNALEVKEAIDVLGGRTTGPLLDISLLLAREMLLAGEAAADSQQAEAMLQKALDEGQGLAKLGEMIAAQGGDAGVTRDTSRLPQARHQLDVPAQSIGTLSSVDTQAIGLAAQALGAGRRTKEDIIDPAVGLIVKKRIGQGVRQGEALCTLYANDLALAQQAAAALQRAFRLSATPCPPARQLIAIVKNGHTEVF